MGRAIGLAAVVVVVLALAAPASATHVQCGDTITQDTRLDSDVVCTASDSYTAAVTIAASNVTLHLSGYTISNPGGATVEGVQVGTFGNPLTNVHVRKGTITGFPIGVWMYASDSFAEKLHLFATGIGIDNFGSGNFIARNTIERIGSFPSSSAGIWLGDFSGCNCSSEDAYTYHNTIKNMEIGIESRGDNPKHLLNIVSDCVGTSGAWGMRVTGYTIHAAVNRNTVTGCGEAGIYLSSINDGGNARVRLNVSGANRSMGLRVDDATAVIDRNTTNGNTDYGIISLRAGTRIQGNTANSNGGYGIYGVFGTVDGGGNTASGNYDGAPQNQCVNVAC